MSDRSPIEWTEATWNPVTGCTEVSPGCDYCYAKTFAERFRGVPGHHFQNGFDVTLRPERLGQPTRWRKPRRVFVNSMSDLFHDAVPDEFIARVFAAMAGAPQHTFQLLTKRHGRMRSLLNDDGFVGEVAQEIVGNHVVDGDPMPDEGEWWPLRNLWLGVSIENQQWANIRVPALLDTRAAVRWLSCEPLLGPVNLRLGRYAMAPGDRTEGTTLDGIDWVVVGGESGRGARPMHPNWVRFVRDQCVSAGVPFFMKQWGEWGPAPWVVRVCDPETGWRGSDEELAEAKRQAEAVGATHSYAVWAHEYDWFVTQADHKPWSLERQHLAGDTHAPIRRWGKRAAGREVDGRIWDQYPAVAAGATV